MPAKQGELSHSLISFSQFLPVTPGTQTHSYLKLLLLKSYFAIDKNNYNHNKTHPAASE